MTIWSAHEVCHSPMDTTVPVQHRTSLEEGYDAASYLFGYGGSGHGMSIALAVIVVYIFDNYALTWKWTRGFDHLK
jgi:hypothetical protein